MGYTLHITSGDSTGGRLAKSGLPGEMFVWHDILCDGPRCPGWPDEDTLNARADFLEAATGCGLDRRCVLDTPHNQYDKLAEASLERDILLWFDACLFDQSIATNDPLPWIPAADGRWLQERPNPATGLGRVEALGLAAIRNGCDTPGKIFASVAAADTPPQFWRDTTL